MQYLFNNSYVILIKTNAEMPILYVNLNFNMAVLLNAHA